MTEKTMGKGREQREEKEGGRTLGEGTAKSAGEKAIRRYVNEDDSITPEELERLSHIVTSVEHDYFGGSGKGDPFEAYAVYCASVGKRFSVHERGSYYTWADVSDKRGKDIKVNHNDSPVLARLLVERVPQCLPYIELRRSKWDKVFSMRRAYVEATQAAS
jgi:hypothetical protein